MATYNFQQRPDGTVRVTVNDVFNKTYATGASVGYVGESYFDVIDASSVRTHYYAGNDFAINGVVIKGNGVTTIGSMQDIVNELAAVFPNTNDSPENNLIDVFIIAGQSNAKGNGDSAESPAITAGIAYQYYNSALTAITGDPVGNADTGSAWPAFANNYHNKTGRKICFVPTAVGGSVLAKNNEANSISWDVDGDLRGISVAAANAAITALEAADFTIGSVGVLWSQGEKDAANNNAGATTVNEYETALTNLINYYKDNFPGIGFYIFRTGTDTGASDVGFSRIRQVQEDVADSNTLASVVYRGAVTFAARSLLHADGVHYLQAGYNEMGSEGADGVIAGDNPIKFSGTGIFYTDVDGNDRNIANRPVKVSVQGENPFTTLATASDITGLTIPVKANRKYTLTASLWIGCNNTGGLQFAINGPAGMTIGTGRWNGSSTAANVVQDIRVTGVGVLTSSTAFNRVNAQNGMVDLLVDITIGATAGNVTLQFASAVAGQQSTVYIDSWLMAMETD